MESEPIRFTRGQKHRLFSQRMGTGILAVKTAIDEIREVEFFVKDGRLHNLKTGSLLEIAEWSSEWDSDPPRIWFIASASMSKVWDGAAWVDYSEEPKWFTMSEVWPQKIHLSEAFEAAVSIPGHGLTPTAMCDIMPQILRADQRDWPHRCKEPNFDEN